jgi:hypothetical protein
LALHRIEKFGKRNRFCHIESAVHLKAEFGARLFHFHLVDITDRDLGAQIVQRGRGSQSDSPCATRDDHHLSANFVADFDADGSSECHVSSTALGAGRRNERYAEWDCANGFTGRVGLD